MRKCFVFLCLLFSSQLFAMYIERQQPQGKEIDLNVEAITIVFSDDIIKLGEQVAIKPEHLALLKFDKIDCTPHYSGTKTIVCKLNRPLAPNTTYTYSVEAGFAGVNQDDRLGYQNQVSFTTVPLTITSYQVSWIQDVPQIKMDFNIRVKAEGRSGTIQCGERTLGVEFEALKDKKGEANFVAKADGPLKTDESCVFYFNRPLSYRDHVGSHVPEAKIILDRSVSGLDGNQGQFDFHARCQGNYQLSANLFSGSMPYLKCEFNDVVYLDIPLDARQSVNVSKLISVIPKEQVKVEYKDERIVLHNFPPNHQYLIKISKDLPLFSGKFTKDVVFQLETMHNPPLISPVKPTGVIEKNGPWQIGYSALNVESLEVIYDFFDSPEKLNGLDGLNVSTEKLKERQVLKLEQKENENVLRPLNVKELPKAQNFKAGLFTGVVKVKDAQEKYLQAEREIFSEEHFIKTRKEFRFSYLFTDIGLHVKRGKKGVLVWANSLEKGKPLKNVDVRFISQGLDQKAQTDADGLAFFPDIMTTREQNFTVVASLDDDISFLNSNAGSFNTGISHYDFNLDNWWNVPTKLIVDIVAERPLYLPNEKVHLKFFVRKRIPDSIDVEDAGKKLKATIFDSRGNEVLVKEIELNKYGTSTLEYQLPAKAPTGRYAVYLQQDETTVQLDAVFQVEEFRKPEFKVSLGLDPQGYAGKLSYFKGGPVKDTEGEMAVIFKKTSFKPEDERLERFAFPSSIWSYWSEDNDVSELRVLSRNPIESNAQGEFKFPKSKIGETKEYGTLIVEASFKDENGGTISGRVSSKVNPFDYIPGIDLSKWLYSTGEKIDPSVVAIGKDGKHTSNLKMKIDVIKVDYIYERRLGSGNYFYYDSRREEKNVGSCTFTTTPDFKACDLTVKEAGYYEFVTTLIDKKLKAESAKTSTYVYQQGEFLGFEATNHDRINLAVDSSKLKLGDKLKVMAISPLQDAEALITFERDGILYKEQVAFKGNVLLYEKVITDEKLIPGFYVSVVIVKGRTSDKIVNHIDLGRPAFKIGYKKIEVANFEKRLQAKVTPQSAQVEPGQTMEATIQLTDHKGRKVQGELAIAVVDDALLTLSGAYQSNYDILDTFYSLGNLGVDNYQTLTQLIGRRTFGKKGANAGGGGGVEVRSDFKNTAFWEAQAETDEKGSYKIKFKVPDNLTTWKIIVAAVDNDHRFGMGENEFIVSKSLMIEPALPNFLVDGDKFNAKVVLTNRSGKTQDIKVEASSPQLAIKENKAKLSLKHDDKGSLFFPMSVPRAQKVDVTFKAIGQGATDGFKTVIPVNSSGIQHAFTSNGVLKGSKNLALSIKSEAYPESLSLAVKTSTTAIEGLDEVFRYVLTYPYGCWEQRLTSAYFLVQYEAFKEVLTFRFKEDQGSLKSSVQTLLNLAADYQAANGGMKYYPGGSDEPDVYLSVFTAQSFATMKQLGYSVDAKVEASLKEYLKNLLVSDQNWSRWYGREVKATTRSMILEALTQLGEKNLSTHVSKLYAERNTLDLFGLSQLFGFMQTQKGFENESKLLFDKIESLKVASSGHATYREPIKFAHDDYKFWNYTSQRSVCAALQSLTKYSKDKAALLPVVKSVLSSLKEGHWYNTQENIYCFEALRLYSQKFETQKSDEAVKVSLDGKESKAQTLKTKFSSSVVLKSNELSAATKQLELKTSDKGEQYFSTVLRYETPYAPRPKLNQGFTLTKLIERFDSEKKSWVQQTEDTLNLRRGDILRISLKVTIDSDRHQVMLNDQLAGCLEPVNTQLATASLANASMAAKTGTKKYEWESAYYRGNGFEYLDLRLDAAQFYARKIPKGTYHVEYMVQAVATGEFFMPESTIEEMYYPDVRGTEKARKLIVHE